MSFLFKKNEPLYDIIFLVIVMKSKKIIKNGISIVLFILMISFFIYFGTKDYSIQIEDNIKFSNEYKDISKNNLFTYAKEHEILDILNGKSGVIFMGFANNIWSHYYADYLNELAIANTIDRIYYYDFKKDRELNNATYLNIVEKLKEYLYTTDTGSMDVTAPTILIVKNGKILYYNAEVSLIAGNITPEDYFNDYRKNLLKANIDNALKLYKEEDAS